MLARGPWKRRTVCGPTGNTYHLVSIHSDYLSFCLGPPVMSLAIFHPNEHVHVAGAFVFSVPIKANVVHWAVYAVRLYSAIGIIPTVSYEFARLKWKDTLWSTGDHIYIYIYIYT